MAMLDVSCNYSTVKNTSGVRKKFGFLPPHGRELAVNEEFTVFGDIRQALYRFERTEGRRNVTAFENALRRGDIEIINTPNVVLEDLQNPGVSKILTLRNNALGTAVPCWNAESSLSEEYDG